LSWNEILKFNMMNDCHSCCVQFHGHNYSFSLNNSLKIHANRMLTCFNQNAITREKLWHEIAKISNTKIFYFIFTIYFKLFTCGVEIRLFCINYTHKRECYSHCDDSLARRRCRRRRKMYKFSKHTTLWAVEHVFNIDN
jgi:hypothetical protein